ncbi:nucleotide-binding alpha-beta plait domain-containing protein, partial [Tanacetum coccineum]
VLLILRFCYFFVPPLLVAAARIISSSTNPWFLAYPNPYRSDPWVGGNNIQVVAKKPDTSKKTSYTFLVITSFETTRELFRLISNIGQSVEYANGDDIRTLNCGHVFHTCCIKQWLTREICFRFAKVDVPTLKSHPLRISPGFKSITSVIKKSGVEFEDGDDLVSFSVIYSGRKKFRRGFRNELLCVKNKVDVNDISRLKAKHSIIITYSLKPSGYTHQNGNYVPKKTEANSNNGHRTDKRSYVNVVNGDTKSTEACEPALLLDESCLNQLDYSLGLLGKVKEFSSFDNMRMVLGNEGFDDINLRYMGGMWIMIGFKTEDTKAKFQSCLGATSWFSLLIQASKEFVIDERITWVDIEGIPLKLWSESTFNRIAAKWGKMLYLEKLDEGCLYSKRLCILTTGKSNILETFKIIHKGKRFLVRAKETMGWIPDFDAKRR